MSYLAGLLRPVAYVSVPLYLLHKASEVHPLAQYYIRLGLYLGTLGLTSCWGMIVAVGMSLAGRQLDVNYVFGRSFYHLTSRVLGITLRVEGEEHIARPGAAVMVGNHQSMLDIIYLGRCANLYLLTRSMRPDNVD
jgi:lysophosphatidate acyltransferase